MPPTLDRAVDLVALGVFALALVHTFAAKQFERLARRFPRHAGLFHLLGEVEVVFGFWAIVLVVAMAVMKGGSDAFAYCRVARLHRAAVRVRRDGHRRHRGRCCLTVASDRRVAGRAVLPLPTPVATRLARAGRRAADRDR